MRASRQMNRSKIIEVSYIITSQLINYTELQKKIETEKLSASTCGVLTKL